MTAFKLETFMDELAEACKTVKGLDRAYGYPPEKIEPPAALVAWPNEVIYSQTYSAGSQHEGEDQYEIPLFVVHGIGGTSRARRNKIAGWIARDIRRAVNNHEYTGSPLVWVWRAETDTIELGNKEYLATLFTVKVQT